MNFKKILFLVAICVALPAPMLAESSMNAVDAKIAKLVGKDNVGTAKKVVAGIVITAIALPVLYFASRAALKPCLKYQGQIVEENKPMGATSIMGKAFVKANKLTYSDFSADLVPQKKIKSVLQKFYRIKPFDKDGNPIANNWKQEVLIVKKSK